MLVFPCLCDYFNFLLVLCEFFTCLDHLHIPPQPALDSLLLPSLPISFCPFLPYQDPFVLPKHSWIWFSMSVVGFLGVREKYFSQQQMVVNSFMTKGEISHPTLLPSWAIAAWMLLAWPELAQILCMMSSLPRIHMCSCPETSRTHCLLVVILWFCWLLQFFFPKNLLTDLPQWSLNVGRRGYILHFPLGL